MGDFLEEELKKLPEAEQERILAEGKRRYIEYQTLKEFEKAKDSAQAQLKNMLNIGQDSVGLIEKQSNLMLFIVRNHIEAMGGTLTLTIEFPGHVPVALDGFTYDDDVEDVEELIEHYSDGHIPSA